MPSLLARKILQACSNSLFYSKSTVYVSCFSPDDLETPLLVTSWTSLITRPMYCCSTVSSPLYLVHKPISRSQICFKSTSFLVVHNSTFSALSACTSISTCIYSHNATSNVSFSFANLCRDLFAFLYGLRVPTTWFLSSVTLYNSYSSSFITHIPVVVSIHPPCVPTIFSCEFQYKSVISSNEYWFDLY